MGRGEKREEDLKEESKEKSSPGQGGVRVVKGVSLQLLCFCLTHAETFSVASSIQVSDPDHPPARFLPAKIS